MSASKYTLREMVDEVDLEDQEFKAIMYNLLCAVHFLHSANIIHRDLKPENILINESCEFQICDFGLARTLPESC